MKWRSLSMQFSGSPRAFAATTIERGPLVRQPLTELDARFSEPNSVATDWDETRRALEEAQLFWIATVRADGRPHVTPLVAVWLDDAIYFATGRRELVAEAMDARRQAGIVHLRAQSPPRFCLRD
jgi:predicted pyridoxine 5'-phosphate oxidase superfamily flavin-nucleotide-binding protein